MDYEEVPQCFSCTFIPIPVSSACWINPKKPPKRVSVMQEEAQKAGVKLLGSYVAAHEHTVYSIIEADDIQKLERVLVPMTLWGNARLIPVVAAQQATVGTR